MKITVIEATPFAIPFTKPLKFASGEIHTPNTCLYECMPTMGSSARRPPRGR